MNSPSADVILVKKNNKELWCLETADPDVHYVCEV